jgi:hypothetical protein
VGETLISQEIRTSRVSVQEEADLTPPQTSVIGLWNVKIVANTGTTVENNFEGEEEAYMRLTDKKIGPGNLVVKYLKRGYCSYNCVVPVNSCLPVYIGPVNLLSPAGKC